MNPFFFPRLGGIERRMYHLARALAVRGHESTVLTAQGPGEPAREEMEGFQVIRLPARALPIPWDPPVLRTRGVEAALRSLGADVADFHYRWAPEWARAVEGAGVPWVFTWHNQYGEGSGPLRPLSLLNDRGYRRRVLAGARRVVCISDYIRAELEGRAFPPAALDVVPNGSEPPAPGGPEWQPDDGRALPEAPYFAAVGRLTPEKGNDLVLRAFAHARAAGADARLVLCGRGPRRASLERLARRLGVDGHVTFAGWVPEETKWRLLRGAAGLLHMARFESYGIAVAEGVVAGTPVVAASVGGVAEVAGDAGVMVPPGDVEAAGAAAARLVQEPAWQRELAARARRRAPELSWGPVADRMEAIYRAAC